MSGDKVFLFDGVDLNKWTTRSKEEAKWTISNGSTTVTEGDIISKIDFGDAHIHVEFCEPVETTGNSGVYIHGCYEIQILKTYDVEKPGKNDCAAVYDMYAPIANACLPPTEWQTYDIFFRAPRFDGEKIVEYARLTMLHNGTLVHNNVTLNNVTPGGVIDTIVARGPLVLQDHGHDPVSFRNVWIKSL
jgi:hypothetical protein